MLVGEGVEKLPFNRLLLFKGRVHQTINSEDLHIIGRL